MGHIAGIQKSLVASSLGSHTPLGGGTLEYQVIKDGSCLQEIHMLGEVERLKGKHLGFGPDHPGFESCVTSGAWLNFSGLASSSIQGSS